MLLKHLLNLSSLTYFVIFVISIVEVSLASSINSTTKKRYQEDGTNTYFVISDIILPPLPALEILGMISYGFLIFLHTYKRKRLVFAMKPENKNLRQQPVKEKDDGYLFFTLFKAFLISLFHAFAIFFCVKAENEYKTIDGLNTGMSNNDLISKVHSLFALNIVSLVFFYLSIVIDTVLHNEEKQFFKRLLYTRAES